MSFSRGRSALGQSLIAIVIVLDVGSLPMFSDTIGNMNALHNKKILLGVTGGIAAYKAAEFCRLLIKQGAEVQVVMTAAAREFIQPLTFQALTGRPVRSELFDAGADNAMDHIELARWADLLVVAPATADFIAKLEHGYADNLLLTLALANEGPTALAPAMNQQMYLSAATGDNIRSLAKRGVKLWGPDSGEQACGEVGPGRMLEPEAILAEVEKMVSPGPLQGKKVLITAGPTREAIDPVRYLSNRSSGKMGYAVAQAALDAGAEVTLVSGPTCLEPPGGARVYRCQSAKDMLDLVMAHVEGQDIFIATAAVADYRVAEMAANKIKKSSESLSLELVRNPDILARVAALETRPFCVGFAAETQDLEQYAEQKMQRKKLDMIAANRVDGEDSGFEVDDNALSVFWPGGQRDLPRQAKTLIAAQLIDIIADLFLAER
jgi:phosphopantothenoylcysteine decarboxylase/phosphopantothenate--cysteine ligase